MAKRTNVVVDEQLIRRARSLTGISTMRGVIDHALRELLRHKRQRDLLALRGRVEWSGELSALRRGRKFP